jgi:hypothetical protein
MANTLTGLIPSLYSNLDVVSRELVGTIPSAGRDATTDRAAVGQQVLSFVAPAVTASDITPGVIPPDVGDQTIGNVALTVTKSRFVPFRWNGEQTLGLNNNGPDTKPIMVDQMQQAMRTLCNEMETDLCNAATDPFATSLADPAQIRKILDDNGAPAGGRSLIINTAAGAAVRTLSQLTKVNESGTAMTLRDGELLNIHGMSIKESAQIARPTVGTSSNTGTTDTAGYAVGSTTVNIAASGTGTILAGDVISFAGDSNKYLVATGIASLAAGGSIVLAAPGLRKALPASAATITVVAISSHNFAFSQNALYLATRLPALPEGGDLAIDRSTITDPRSGISFEIAMYPQFRQMQYFIGIAWGVKVVKPEHGAILLGA